MPSKKPQNPNEKLANLPTDKVMARLFPKPVIEQVKREAHLPPNPPKKPDPKSMP